MTAASILVVDDEADIRALLEITLSRMGHRSQAAATLAEARERLAEQRFDLCITDMRLPDGSGLELIAHLQARYPGVPVAVLTAYGSAQMAVDSLKAGAFDFVSKPIDLAQLRKLVTGALKLGAPPAAAAPAAAQSLIGEAPAMRELRAMIERLARSQAPVHITGESGTGKERVARAIHAQGPRATGPFVPVNCGAIPGELMESEFFGHRKGAFTGAVRDKAGLFQAAEGGTLFLDEVAELPPHMQAKLLRALQERRVRPVGAETEVAVNARIISATHRDLGALVRGGGFREDFYYRLNVVEVRTPALRERRGDIPLLIDAVLARLGDGAPPTLDASARERLAAYDFPGNVRELENILERALALCDGRAIRAEDLELRGVQKAGNGTAAALNDQLEEIERNSIREALEKARWNKTRAASLLGMSFRQLRYRIKKLGIE